MLQAGEEFLHVADALCAAGGVAEAVVVEVLDVEGEFEAGPFLLGEEVAEVRHADVAHLVGAEGLHGVGVVGVEGEALWGVRLHAGCGVFQVAGEVGQEVEVAEFAARLDVVVEAAVVGGEGVVLGAAFGDDDDVVHGSEVGYGWVGYFFEARSEEAKGP